tara:strand:- start:529 stop:711 length:183 start_codon:yes stop_codon:yes gene_type:complete
MAMRTGNRQSGVRQARHAKCSEQPNAPAYITRKIPYYEFLDEEFRTYITQRKEAMPDAWY